MPRGPLREMFAAVAGGALQRYEHGTSEASTTASGVAELHRAQHSVAFEQFGDAGVDRMRRAKPGRLDLRVGDDVVALVRVFADRRLDKIEIRHLQLYALAQFGLREIGLGLVGVGQADIVNLA